MPPKTQDCDDLHEHDGAEPEIDPACRLPHPTWMPVLQRTCTFPPDIFHSVSLNLIRNPNINSSLLFRADILYDVREDGLGDATLLGEEQREALERYNIRDGDLPGFHITRTIVRRMIPRNPQIDKPIAQTCLFLQSNSSSPYIKQTAVVYIPHAPDVESVPWYHPRVQALAYLHSWDLSSPTENTRGTVSLHYRLFDTEQLPLSPRLLRTAHHLLTTVHKHGQGSLTGYTKRVHHDQLVSQQRVQDRYTDLKATHARRLCDRWVEKTEPSKHVFEDLGIAAFLIELWRDMYRADTDNNRTEDGREDERPVHPGFVDIGCGNGVLVDVLIREGFQGWGFDARKRKTWDTFDESIKPYVQALVLIPQPLFESQQYSSPDDHANGAIISQGLSFAGTEGEHMGPLPGWHNGIFPNGTFIISNHADELTPWTPLLASITSSPFLAIPCCSHNLSGLRFRAPSVFNNNSADTLAPSYFAAHIKKSKSIAIAVACSDNEIIYGQGSEQGDLKDLNAKSRAKQPSAYSSLCDWVAHLAARVGYKVEREMLRLPSTRNVGIVGRAGIPEFEDESLDVRRARVAEIVSKEKADGMLWVERARGLIGGRDTVH